MNETSFWRGIRPHLNRLGHFSRIESPLTAEGHPDLCGAINGVSNQIELKFIKGERLKKDFFRLSQHVWFRDRLKCYEEGKGPIVFTQVVGLGVTIHRGKDILELKDCRTQTDWTSRAKLIYEPTPDSWELFSAVFRGEV